MNIILPACTSDELKQIHEKLIKHHVPDSNILYSNNKDHDGLYLEVNTFLIKRPCVKTCCKYYGKGWGFSTCVATKYKDGIKCDNIDAYLDLDTFLHIPVITADSIKYLNELIESLSDNLEEYLRQDPLSMAIRYYKERSKWKKAGKPVRSKEQVEEIFKICSTCDYFENTKTGAGFCTICGCGIKLDSTDKNFNKLTWATTNCPAKTPKWQSQL